MDQAASPAKNRAFQLYRFGCRAGRCIAPPVRVTHRHTNHLHVPGSPQRSSSVLRSVTERLLRQTDGQDIMEYVLLGAFVALVGYGGVMQLGTAFTSFFTAVNANLVSQSAVESTPAGSPGSSTPAGTGTGTGAGAGTGTGTGSSGNGNAGGNGNGGGSGNAGGNGGGNGNGKSK
jgi:Flp pilus assembly pilin Flp